MTLTSTPESSGLQVPYSVWARPASPAPARRPERGRRRTPAPEPLPLSVLIGAWAMLALSLVAAWLLLFAFVISGLQQHRTNGVLYSQFRESLSAATAPIGGAIPPGQPVALLSLPAAGIPSEVVVEGTSSTDLLNGPGHRRDTPLPGQGGTSFIYGRSLSFGGPFGDIGSLKKGTRFTVTTGQGVFSYSVIGVRHPGAALPPPLTSGRSRITLVTSYGSNLTPTNLLYVDADMEGTAVPTPSGRLRSVPASERAMAADLGSLPQLVFSLQLLIIIALALVWMWQRWGRAQAWLIGVPLLLASLWFSTRFAWVLLPNLI